MFIPSANVDVTSFLLFAAFWKSLPHSTQYSNGICPCVCECEFVLAVSSPHKCVGYQTVVSIQGCVYAPTVCVQVSVKPDGLDVNDLYCTIRVYAHSEVCLHIQRCVCTFRGVSAHSEVCLHIQRCVCTFRGVSAHSEVCLLFDHYVGPFGSETVSIID